MTTQQLVVIFVAVWAFVGLVWIALDWLGSADHGSFRPRGDAIPWRPSEFRRARKLRQFEADQEVRETLQASYGKSSLRVRWSDDDEEATLEDAPPVPVPLPEPVIEEEPDDRPEPAPWVTDDTPAAAAPLPRRSSRPNNLWRSMAEANQPEEHVDDDAADDESVAEDRGAGA